MRFEFVAHVVGVLMRHRRLVSAELFGSSAKQMQAAAPLAEIVRSVMLL